MEFKNIIGVEPDSYPVSVIYLSTYGTKHGPTILEDRDKYQKFLADHSVLAVNFQPLSKVDQFIKERGAYYSRTTLQGLRDFEKWLDNNEPSDNKYAVIDDLIARRVGGVMSGSEREAIRNWFTNPEQYPEVMGNNLKNRILTTKPSGGGKVVVSPNGHTLAYSTVRTFYLVKIVGKDLDQYDFERVRAREYVGGHKTHPVNSRVTLHYQFGELRSVSVGCQKIPVEALHDLAEREGWN